MYFSKSILSVLLLLVLNTLSVFSQDDFMVKGNAKSHSVTFKMINDLIIIPVDVNGSTLNFLLDTGVSNTVMFNLSVEDSTKLKNARKIKIRGLGEGNFIEAIQSTNNKVRIGNVLNNRHLVFLIPGKEFDLSPRLGVSINGIIGGDLFKKLIVDINYSTKKIKFYNPLKYKYRKCKKCQYFDLSFYKGKPYIDIKVKNDNKIIDTKLLIDTGGSKTLWLFDKSSPDIELPTKYFDDFLGKGLSGNIYGRRSKIDEIIIGKYRFANANVSYPDSASIVTAYNFKQRNGSIGAGILKRFRIVYDYNNKKMTIKRKSRYYSDAFQYNKSGLEIIYDGKMLVRKEVQSENSTLSTSEGEKSIVQILYEYVYDFKPIYKIGFVRKNSLAADAGLRVNDIVLEINGKTAYNYKLSEIISLFSQKEGTRIELLIERNRVKMFYSFVLKDMF